MTIQVKLTPELETRLAAEAEALGLPLEEAAVIVLREALGGEFSLPPNLSAEDFHVMLQALAEDSEQLPALSTRSFTRDSFYEDRQ
ncbi:MAG TPA: hypothetical protein VFY05_10645 [Candidatus Angelobacter sp.]|nr:hypothetical protein [Candidatus Angelobacter sp.]